MSDVDRRRVAVVVPTFQRADRLRRLLSALEAQTLPRAEWEAIVVDDCSTDGTARILRELAEASPINLRVARTVRQSGPACARNVGWRSSDAPVVAFTDDDCVPSPGWLSAGVAAIASDPTTGIVQGRSCRADRPADATESIRTVIREVPVPSPWFEGCNLFLRRAALEDGGGFDEDIAWFGEETAMAWSILELGWRRGWAPDAVVVHDVDERSLRWHLRNHYLEGHAVRIAARHPSLRETWWRTWAIERRGAVFALAVVATVAATRRRTALLLALPYVFDLVPPGSLPPSREEIERAVYRLASDTASLAGKLVEGARCRAFVV